MSEDVSPFLPLTSNIKPTVAFYAPGVFKTSTRMQRTFILDFKRYCRAKKLSSSSQ
jgi:hypothetical protein